MNWLFDSPITIALGAIALGFFLGIAWVQTGRIAFLYTIGLVAAVAVGLLILEYNIKTDRELVRDLVYEIAAAVEANDADRVASHVVSSKPEMKRRGKEEMGLHHFTSVTVGRIHNTEEHPEHQPPEILVEFNVTVEGDFYGPQLPGHSFQRWFQLTFWKDTDGQWRIADYRHEEPTAFMRQRD